MTQHRLDPRDHVVLNTGVRKGACSLRQTGAQGAGEAVQGWGTTKATPFRSVSFFSTFHQVSTRQGGAAPLYPMERQGLALCEQEGQWL